MSAADVITWLLIAALGALSVALCFGCKGWWER